MADNNINAVATEIVQCKLEELVDAAYESGFLAGKADAHGTGVWSGFKFGVLVCVGGYFIRKAYKNYKAASEEAEKTSGAWELRLEKIGKEVGDKLEEIEQNL